MKTIICMLHLVVLLISGSAVAQQPDSKPFFIGKARPAGEISRIVSLAPNLTEIIFALGAGKKIVGVTRYDDYPPEVKKIPKAGGFLDPSLETILGLKPDLVVCVPNASNHGPMETLSRMGVAVLVLPAYRLSDVYISVETIGKLLGKEKKAAEIIKMMKEGIKRVQARVVTGNKRKRVLMVYGHKPLVCAGSGSFAHEMMELAGARNVLESSKIRYPTVPMETVVNLAPDVIIDASASGTGASMNPELVREFWKKWKVIPAVKNHRVYMFDSALWFRPGPRLIIGLEKLATLLQDPLHPAP